MNHLVIEVEFTSLVRTIFDLAGFPLLIILSFPFLSHQNVKKLIYIQTNYFSIILIYLTNKYTTPPIETTKINPKNDTTNIYRIKISNANISYLN